MCRTGICFIVLATFFWNAVARCDDDVIVDNVLVKLSDYAEVTSLESGSLAELRATEGLEVKAGDLLARLDDEEEKLLSERARIAAAIAQREADNRVAVDSAQQLLKVALGELRRAREAIVKFPDTISQSEIDRLDLAVEQAKLNLQKAEHEMQQAALNSQQQLTEHLLAEAKLARRQIRSPIDGTVVRIDLKRGEWVEPGKKMLRIASTNRLRVEGVLDAKIAGGLRQGMPVTLAVAEADNMYSGQIVFVSPEVDPFSQQVRIVAELENKNRQLRPGIKGTLTILQTANDPGVGQVRP